MYYLAKFCRICIQTDQKLLDIESTDYDSIKLSEKLKTCTQMVISEESLSTKICTACIQKLRVSYQFHSMCKRSTTILQQYLAELLSADEKIDADKFVNSELRVTLPPLPKAKRKRVGKDERCSLLRKLLSKITEEQIIHNIHLNGLTRLCDNLIPPPAPPPNFLCKRKPELKAKSTNKNADVKDNNCLKNLIRFMKEYDYGYKINDINSICNSCDLTPLEKLKRFTSTFFFDHFGDYRNTIIHIRDSIDFDSSEDEEMFEKCVDESEPENNLLQCKKEVVIVEPDIAVKKEIEFENECDDQSTDFSFSSNLVQACYDDEDTNIAVKQEPEEKLEHHLSFQSIQLMNVCSKSKNSMDYGNVDLTSANPCLGNNYASCSSSTENSSFKIGNMRPSFTCSPLFPGPPVQSNYPLSLYNSSKAHRTLSPHSIRCRTRGHPFISPQLKRQFLLRSFRCEVCNRRFKSPGYLKAHKSKLKH